MSFQETLGVAAAAVSGCSALIYVASILRGETKPNRVAFWIWFAMSGLIFLSYRSSGGTTMWLQLMYVLNPLVGAILSIRYGEGTGLSRLDKTCLTLAAMSVPLWAFLRFALADAASAALPILLINLFADALGTIPVFEKVWNRPETENRLSWLLCVLGAALNVAAVTNWGVADIVWNAWMFGAAGFIASSCYLRPPSTARASET